MVNTKLQYCQNLIKTPQVSVIVSGILLSLAFPKPHLFYLAWVALIPLFILSFREENKRRVFTYFTISGWIFHSLTLNWLIANTFWVGFPAFWGYQLLCITLSIFWGIYGWLTKSISPKSIFLAILIASSLWTGMEYLHSTLFTGFGWCNIGYSQGPDILLSQIVALGTVPIISFFVVGVNYSIAYLLHNQQHRIVGVICATLFLSLPHIIGWALLPKFEEKDLNKIKVAIIQPNFSQEMKFDPYWHYEMVKQTAEFTETLLKNENVDLIFWPEALIMGDYKNPSILEILQRITNKYNAYLITGSTRFDEYGNDYNSSLLISPKGEVLDYYDKVHLAPFGEYLPLSNILTPLRFILPYDVTAGETQKVFEIKNNIKIGPLICFEVLFSPLALGLKKMGANAIAVMTNLAWFGETNAIPQELEITRMRAIETRLPLIHCTNTGISGIFSPSGEFFPAYILVGKNKTLNYPPIGKQPSLSIRTRLGGIFEIPTPKEPPKIWNFYIDKVPLLIGISGIFLLIIQKLAKTI